MKKTLTFTIRKARVLTVECFENYTSGCASIASHEIELDATPEDIHKKVLEIENKQRTRWNAEQQRNVVYCYWVTEHEVMTDNRSVFGHSNQSSTKRIGVSIPATYVRGEIMTIGQALAKNLNKEFSSYSGACLSNLISIHLGFDEENLTRRQLATKIVMVPGERNRETFFEVCPKGGSINLFKEDELSPFKKEAV